MWSEDCSSYGCPTTWQMEIAKEMRSVGYFVDFKKIVESQLGAPADYIVRLLNSSVSFVNDK
jgi:hypothetical protein